MKVAIPLTLLFLVFQYIVIFKFDEVNNARLLISFITTIVSIGFVVSLSQVISKWNLSTLKLIGSSSMTIYLLHILTGSATRVFLQKVIEVSSYEIHLILGIASGVILPILIVYFAHKINFFYIEQAPISRFFKNKQIKTNSI